MGTSGWAGELDATHSWGTAIAALPIRGQARAVDRGTVVVVVVVVVDGCTVVVVLGTVVVVVVVVAGNVVVVTSVVEVVVDVLVVLVVLVVGSLVVVVDVVVVVLWTVVVVDLGIVVVVGATPDWHVRGVVGVVGAVAVAGETSPRLVASNAETASVARIGVTAAPAGRNCTIQTYLVGERCP